MKKIFDIGLHKGFDTEFYLNRNFNVVSVDADIQAIGAAHIKFKSFISSGQLILLHKGIAKEKGQSEFFISNNKEWNSFSKSIANRNQQLEKSITIDTITLSGLFEQYGIPYYCKIDIEGADLDALSSLKNSINLPKYISVESECIGENEIITSKEITSTLDLLYELGYNKFKLIDQNSLSVLRYNEPFFSKNIWYRLKRKFRRSFAINERTYLNHRFSFDFQYGCSGVFGDLLDGKWYDYDTAKLLLLEKRQEYFKLDNIVSYSFWCDWHAMKK
jgi:FkbM family methyltransferase